jgi:hypothetical protein
MSDDNDPIRRGDVLTILTDGECYAVSDVWSAIRVLPAVQPRVKPLVWTYPTPADRLCHAHETAPSFGGAYHISPDEDSSLGYWLLQWTLRVDDFCTRYGGKITRHNDPEAAKAAAQADYEARILSALEPAVQPDAAAIREEQPDSLDRVARAICLASFGDTNPVPVPDELMPRAWELIRDRYLILAEAAIRALIDNPGKEVMPDGSDRTEADIGPGDEAVAGAAQDGDVEREIDALRLKAFETNAPSDREAYFKATSKWFQDRHYRYMAAQPELVSGAAPWPVGLIHLTNTRDLDCATKGCGRRVSTRFAGSDYCEPCGRKVVALVQKGDSHE